MLLTTCPNCSAQFKVQPEQLNVRQGRVMCGRCRNVFNAFQSLTRVAESEIASQHPAPVAELLADELSLNLTDAIFLREEPLPMSQEFSQTDFESDIQKRAPSVPAIEIRPDPAAIVFQEQSPLPPLSRHPPTAITMEVPAGNPLLSPSSRHQTITVASRTRLWSFGAAILLLALSVQIVYGYRSVLMQSYPQLRPIFVAVCEWAGCRLPWGRDDSAIRIEASDLIETPGRAGQIQLTATLVNRGTTRQDLPALELKLTDNANQVILSRILLPHEYLGRTPAKEESLVPNAEMYVNLNIELANKTTASGYGVRAFYN